MNNRISTLIRHGLTYLAGLGGFLFQHGLIDASGVDAANTAGAQLVDPLSLLCGLVAAVAMRCIIGLLGKIFPSLAEKAAGGMPGGVFLLVACGAAAALMGALPSCSPAQLAAARAVPVRSCLVTDYGSLCYSSKSGLAVSVDTTSGK